MSKQYEIKKVSELEAGDKLTGNRTVVKVVETPGFKTQVFHGDKYNEYVPYHPYSVELVEKK